MWQNTVLDLGIHDSAWEHPVSIAVQKTEISGNLAEPFSHDKFQIGQGMCDKIVLSGFSKNGNFSFFMCPAASRKSQQAGQGAIK